MKTKNKTAISTLIAVTVAFLILVAFSATASAAVINVPTAYPTIQAAIDNASSGDTIIVSAGTYTEYLHITTDDLTIEGAGIDQSIIDLDGLTPYWHYSGCSRSYASRSGVLISGYGSPDQIVEDITFNGFTVKNAGLNPPTTATGTHTGPDNSAVLIDSTASWTPGALIGQWVHNIDDRDTDYKPSRSYGQITGNTGTAVTATLKSGQENDWDKGDKYVITYEHYYDQFGDGQDDVRGITIGNGKNILIQNCKVVNSGYGGISAGLARCVSSHKYSEGVTVDNCISSDHPVAGISIGKYYRGPTWITNNICSNNKMPNLGDPTREYSGFGIQVQGKWSSNMVSGVISDNICRDNGFEGIILAKYTDGVIVENNVVTGHNFDEDGAGIFLYHYGKPQYCKNHIIRNNMVTGNIRGIVAWYASNSIIEHNNVETDPGTFAPGQPAIKIHNSNNIEARYNHIHGADGHGVLLVYSDNSSIHKNTVNNNNGAGIYLYGSDNNEIHKNKANHNIYGIRIRYSDDNDIERNTAHANEEYDLFEEGSTGNTWVNNKYKTKNW